MDSSAVVQVRHGKTRASGLGKKKKPNRLKRTLQTERRLKRYLLRPQEHPIPLQAHPSLFDDWLRLSTPQHIGLASPLSDCGLKVETIVTADSAPPDVVECALSEQQPLTSHIAVGDLASTLPDGGMRVDPIVTADSAQPDVVECALSEQQPLASHFVVGDLASTLPDGGVRVDPIVTADSAHPDIVECTLSEQQPLAGHVVLGDETSHLGIKYPRTEREPNSVRFDVTQSHPATWGTVCETKAYLSSIGAPSETHRLSQLDCATKTNNKRDVDIPVSVPTDISNQKEKVRLGNAYRVRTYVTQALSTELDHMVADMLTKLFAFQERTRQKVRSVEWSVVLVFNSRSRQPTHVTHTLRRHQFRNRLHQQQRRLQNTHTQAQLYTKATCLRNSHACRPPN
jgi:hypothetical protein